VNFTIRTATQADIPQITRIYNELGVATVSSYDLEPVSEQNRLAWLHDHLDNGYPILVAVDGDQVLGYAGYSMFKEKLGYRFTVENTIYIDPAAQGQHVGTALMERVIQIGRDNHIHTMIALINSTNQTSLEFHKKLGFTDCGVLPQSGFKFGEFLDVCILAYIYE
jgi:phosphinothricin acetyltransferase